MRKVSHNTKIYPGKTGKDDAKTYVNNVKQRKLLGDLKINIINFMFLNMEPCYNLKK